jgi:hypothetical protein
MSSSNLDARLTSPLRASFHSCTRWTASSYTVIGFFALSVSPPFEGFGTSLLPPMDVALRLSGREVEVGSFASELRFGVETALSMLRLAEAIQGCRKSFFALIRRLGSFWKH